MTSATSNHRCNDDEEKKIAFARPLRHGQLKKKLVSIILMKIHGANMKLDEKCEREIESEMKGRASASKI